MIYFIIASTLCAQPVGPEAPTTYLGKTVNQWINVLRDESIRDRSLAISAVAAFGPAANDSIPDLIAILKNPRFSRDDMLTESLGRIGPEAVAAVPHLITLLIKEGCTHAKQGTFVTSRFGPKFALTGIGAPAVPALVELLDGPNREMRPCAAEILGEIGPEAVAAVPSLIRGLCLDLEPLDLDDEALRRLSISALGNVGPKAKAATPSFKILFKRKPTIALVEAWGQIGAPPVAELVERLSDQNLDESDSFSAAYAMQKLGPKAKEAVPALRKALTDPRPQVRLDAAVALAYVDPLAPESLPTLIEGLSFDPKEVLTRGIPDALIRIGPPAKAAIPALIRQMALGYGDDGTLKALLQFDPQGHECLPTLIAALRSDDISTVKAAADSLGCLGPFAKDAVPELIAAMMRANDDVFSSDDDPQAAATRALGRIGPGDKAVIPALIQALELRHLSREEHEKDYRGETTVAQAAAEVLGSFGPESRSAVAALTRVVASQEDADTTSWGLRPAAAQALGRIGPEARSAIPFLKKATAERHPRLVPAAMIALAQLAPDGKNLAETWTASTTDPDGRAQVLGALGKTSFEADVLTRDSMEVLNGNIAAAEADAGDESRFAYGFLQRIGRLGVGARLAIPRLSELQSHRNPWLRQQARETLAKIVPAAKPPGT